MPTDRRATRFGQDASGSILTCRSWNLWLLGYPAAALRDTVDALKNARKIGQAATSMFQLANTSMTQPYPMQRRTRPTKPLPEPADATFTVLLQEAAQSGSRRRRAWAQLIDHLIAGERDAEHEELRGLIAYCHERVDLLNSRDADFIVSMKRIVERYAVTPRQRRWALISSIGCYSWNASARGIGGCASPAKLTNANCRVRHQ